jgi:hypothetical protein
MKTKKYIDGKDKLNASEEVARKTRDYMKAHPDADYLEASNAVLHADTELAKDYAGGTGTYAGEIDTRPSFAPAEPKKKSEYQKGLQASAEIARLSEIEMLENDLTYEVAQKLVLAKNPELLKAYCAEIIG